VSVRASRLTNCLIGFVDQDNLMAYWLQDIKFKNPKVKIRGIIELCRQISAFARISWHTSSPFLCCFLWRRGKTLAWYHGEQLCHWAWLKCRLRCLFFHQLNCQNLCCSGMTIHETKSWLAVTFDNFGRLWLRRECGMVHRCVWWCSVLMLSKLLCAVPLSSGSVGLALFFWSSWWPPRRLEKNNVVLVGSATKIIKLFWESN
jgi:hypothetical protein